MAEGRSVRRMIGGFGRGAAIAAMLGAIGVGAPVAGMKSPAPPSAIAVSTGQKDERRRRWRRTRAQIMARSLTWRGVGMFSRGPRWPSVARVGPTRQLVRANDGTQYRLFSDRSVRRDPMEVNAYTRYTFAIRRCQRLPGESPATHADRVRRTMTNGALKKFRKRLKHNPATA